MKSSYFEYKITRKLARFNAYRNNGELMTRAYFLIIPNILSDCNTAIQNSLRSKIEMGRNASVVSHVPIGSRKFAQLCERRNLKSYGKIRADCSISASRNLRTLSRSRRGTLRFLLVVFGKLA